MSGDRPRPQYGEYASPEEQARAMGRERPALPPPPPVNAVAAPHLPPPPDASRPLPAAAAATARPWDLMLSALLLIVGLGSVFYTFAVMGQLPTVLSRTFTLMGITRPFTDTGAASAVARAVDIVYGALWILALAGTILARRRHRLAFWIPLLAGILAFVIWAVLLSTLIAHDPAFIAYSAGLSG